jgi:hypothetical protein
MLSGLFTAMRERVRVRERERERVNQLYILIDLEQ